MLTATFAQKVHAQATALHNPIHTRCPINEPQHLYPIELTSLAGPTGNALDSFHFTFRDTGAGHLDAIDIEVLQ